MDTVYRKGNRKGSRVPEVRVFSIICISEGDSHAGAMQTATAMRKCVEGRTWSSDVAFLLRFCFSADDLAA